MKVLDYKNVNLAEIMKKYNKLDEDYLSCASFEEQRAVLRDFYSESTFVRDELVERKFHLGQKQTPMLKIASDYYIGISVSFVMGLLTSLLSSFFDDEIIDVSLSSILRYLFFVFLFVAGICFDLKGEKANFRKRDVRVQEVFAFELQIVETALSSDKEEICYDDLLLIIEKEKKT